MSPRFSFRIGMISGALLLAAVLFVFLFLSFALTTRNGSSGTTALDNGVLPDPYPLVDLDLPLQDDDHVLGNRDAEFLFVEYSDLECPFCQRFHVNETVPSAIEALQEQGVDVAWTFRHYPLDFHEGADVAAEMTECVAQEAGNEAFWKFVETYFAETGSNGLGIDQERILEIAVEAGATREGFTACLDEQRFAQNVQEEMDTATQAYGMGTQYGTPTTFVVDTTNGQVRAVVGAVDAGTLVEAVELLRDDR